MNTTATVNQGQLKRRTGDSSSEKRRRGFSLVEVIIVIAVMASLAAIAVPSYRTFMAKSRLNEAARQVMSDLMAVRMQAVSQNRAVTVLLLDDHRYQAFIDNDNNGSIDTGETAFAIQDIHPDYYDVTLTITQSGGSPVSPRFTPNGTGSPTTITATSSATGTSKNVTVSLAGRVKIS